MQKQEIEQTIYRKTQQLAVEGLEEVLRFVEFVQFKIKKSHITKIGNRIF